MRIFLIGFMGSGKSTLAKEIAGKINYEFIDLDAMIVSKAGKTIGEIFAEDGEAKFREIEHVCLKEVVLHENAVIATGGGTPCHFNNMEIINNNGLSIYLKMNSGILTSRLWNSKSERPLLINANNKMELQDHIEKLIAVREKYYLQSMIMVDAKNINAKSMIKNLGLSANKE